MDNQESKFNFSEEESKTQETIIEEQKEAMMKDAKGLASSFKQFLNGVFGFRQDTERDATIEAIKSDIPFKGATAWILICSIMVASVGLNANSTAVVIGAMLISPLMGPILGVGLSIAINDIDTLRKSLINLAVMIVLSLLTAFLFFWLFPLSEDTSELLGRTRPDIRDVLIAFFGGLALIIARTKKGTIASVIFGVAIATALMPPLCTAGYGLAKGNWSYFGGAMYLFSINTVFIALATFLVLKLLRFPMLRYANSAKRRRIANFAAMLAVVAMVPAGWTFYNVWQESKLENDYKQFISKEVESNESLWLQREKLDTNNKTITLFFNGEIAQATETDLRNELNKYTNIKEFDLVINGNKNVSAERLMDLYDKALVSVEKRDSLLFIKQKELDSINAFYAKKGNLLDANNFSLLAKDAKIKFTDLQYFGYAKMLESSDFRKIDTVAVANVRWNTTLTDSIKAVREQELNDWLKKELNIEKLVIKRN